MGRLVYPSINDVSKSGEGFVDMDGLFGHKSGSTRFVEAFTASKIDEAHFRFDVSSIGGGYRHVDCCHKMRSTALLVAVCG